MHKKIFRQQAALHTTGDSIFVANADWKFSGNMVKNFRNHIHRSVPFYEEGQNLIIKLSDFFVKRDSICYDLGCSLGDLLIKLVGHNTSKPQVKWYGLDCEPDMIRAAKKNLKGYKKVYLKTADVNGYAFQKADMIIAYYCVQFIHPKVRQELISRIYESLEWGGAFIWFEKVRAPDARFQDMMTHLYTDFKLGQGYSEDQIIEKSRSLKGILEPFSTFGNMALLKRAGFVDIMTVFKYVCFEGYLAIK